MKPMKLVYEFDMLDEWMMVFLCSYKLTFSVCGFDHLNKRIIEAIHVEDSNGFAMDTELLPCDHL